MERILFVIFIAWLLLFLAVSPVRADVIHYLMVQKQSEPMQISTDKGEESGVITDLVREIFHDSPHQIVIERMPYKKIQRQIMARKYTNWIIYGSPAWSFPQNSNLSPTPIFTARHSLLIPINSKFKYTGLDSILGKTLVLIVGYNYPGLDPLLERGEIHDVRMVNYKQVFMELLSRDRFTGFVEMNFRVQYQLKRVREQGMKISEQSFTQADFSEIIPPYDIHLAMDPNMPEHLQTFIDQRIRALREDGTLKEIMASYR